MSYCNILHYIMLYYIRSNFMVMNRKCRKVFTIAPTAPSPSVLAPKLRYPRFKRGSSCSKMCVPYKSGPLFGPNQPDCGQGSLSQALSRASSRCAWSSCAS